MATPHIVDFRAAVSNGYVLFEYSFSTCMRAHTQDSQYVKQSFQKTAPLISSMAVYEQKNWFVYTSAILKLSAKMI